MVLVKRILLRSQHLKVSVTKNKCLNGLDQY